MDQDVQAETHVVPQLTNVRRGREIATLIQNAKLAWCAARITATKVALTGTGVMTAAITQVYNPIYIIFTASIKY